MHKPSIPNMDIYKKQRYLFVLGDTRQYYSTVVGDHFKLVKPPLGQTK